MNWYHIAIFVHIVGVLAIISALTIVTVVCALLRKVTKTSNLKAFIPIVENIGKLFGLSSTVIILSGIWLTVLHLRHTSESSAWIVVALLTFVAIGIMGSVRSKSMLPSLEKAAKSSKEELPVDVRNALPTNSVLSGTVSSFVIILGILSLMIFQPGLMYSILTILVAVAIGQLLAGQMKGNN